MIRMPSVSAGIGQFCQAETRPDIHAWDIHILLAYWHQVLLLVFVTSFLFPLVGLVMEFPTQDQSRARVSDPEVGGGAALCSSQMLP